MVSGQTFTIQSIALLLCGVALSNVTLSVGPAAVNQFLVKLLFWLSCQGLVFLMQNYYQRRRLYTRIALGKSNVMDVVGGESSAGNGQLYILYPFLFGWPPFRLRFECKSCTCLGRWLDGCNHCARSPSGNAVFSGDRDGVGDVRQCPGLFRLPGKEVSAGPGGVCPPSPDKHILICS